MSVLAERAPQQQAEMETDLLLLLDIDRTSFDTESFREEIGRFAVESFGVDVQAIEHERRHAIADGRSFHVVSCVEQELGLRYPHFAEAFLANHEPDSFTHPDAIIALGMLADAGIPVVAMTQGRVTDQLLKLATSKYLSELPYIIVNEGQNKSEILNAARQTDGRYHLHATKGSVRTYVAPTVALADDRRSHFRAVQPGAQILPFYLKSRALSEVSEMPDASYQVVANLIEVAEQMSVFKQGTRNA